MKLENEKEMELEDDKWKQELDILIRLIQNHYCELKKLQLKINELDSRVQRIDKKIFFFEIVENDKNGKKK